MAIQSFLLICIVYLIPAVTGHGYMTKPAGRNSMWRYGFKNPSNFDDNGLNCGGFSLQWDTNKGKCGVCGDPFGGRQRHVFPGKFANGVIAATYRQGQVVNIEFKITAQHQGWIEFRVGDIGRKPITQAKLRHLLPVVGANGIGTRFYFPPKSGTGVFKTKVKLPNDLTCSNCVMQWWWVVGNSFGCDKSGCGLGRGKQETFVNCADIKINPSSGVVLPPVPRTEEPRTRPPVRPKPPVRTKPPVTTNGNCKAIGVWSTISGMNKWCQENCPTLCPPTHCECFTM